MDNKELIDIVRELNNELFDKGEEELSFTFLTDGFSEYIMFNDHMIWNSDDDDRNYDHETNDYEPLLPHLKKHFNHYVNRLNELKL